SGAAFGRRGGRCLKLLCRSESRLIGPNEGLRVFRSTESVSFAAQSGPRARRACREEEALFRRADYVGPAAGHRGDSRGGRRPAGRDLRADVLSLEEGLRRDAPQRGARAEAIAGRECQTETARGGAVAR